MTSHPSEPESAGPAVAARPVLLGVTATENASTVEVQAELQFGDRMCTGVCIQPAGNLELAAASATLRAVEQAKPVTMQVNEIMYADAVTSRVGVVVVDMAGMRRPLTGSALVDDDPAESFGRAALDAINRIITDERLLNETVRSAAMEMP